MGPNIRIESAVSEADFAAVRALFLEYRDGLGVDLEFQGFAAELAGLPGAYAPPDGRLLLASVDGMPTGCGALRKWSDGTCEMKRLYVRPTARGHRLGRTLAERLVEEARAAGYLAMRLDTLPSMVAAQTLYAALGFREIPPYRHNPVSGTKFFELAIWQNS
ncbi:MAG TPA: GNAT family N-acetyltransferase [Thermoanaerobaculia bacterium]|nr:GNAT family N-acetyltransferase [Thermoanaerobaculia bacterium]